MKSKECVIIEKYRDKSLLCYNVNLRILPVQVQRVILCLMLLYNYLLVFYFIYYFFLFPLILSIIPIKSARMLQLQAFMRFSSQKYIRFLINREYCNSYDNPSCKKHFLLTLFIWIHESEFRSSYHLYK